MDRRGQFGILIFIIFIVLIIAIIFVFILLNGKDEPYKTPEPNVSVNITYYDIVLASNADSRISYILSNGSTVLVRGQLFPNAFEEYAHVAENTTLFLSGFSELYYFNMTKCMIQTNKQLCRVSMKRKAVDSVVSLTSDRVIIDPKNGTLQQPIYLCFSYKSNVQNIVMNLSTIPVPADLSKSHDLCYVYPYDIKSLTIFSINIHKNPFNLVDDVLTVTVRDYESKGYFNIGDKSAGVIV